jgi:hypothetical protein
MQQVEEVQKEKKTKRVLKQKNRVISKENMDSSNEEAYKENDSLNLDDFDSQRNMDSESRYKSIVDEESEDEVTFQKQTLDEIFEEDQPADDETTNELDSIEKTKKKKKWTKKDEKEMQKGLKKQQRERRIEKPKAQPRERDLQGPCLEIVQKRSKVFDSRTLDKYLIQPKLTADIIEGLPLKSSKEEQEDNDSDFELVVIQTFDTQKENTVVNDDILYDTLELTTNEETQGESSQETRLHQNVDSHLESSQDTLLNFSSQETNEKANETLKVSQSLDDDFELYIDEDSEEQVEPTPSTVESSVELEIQSLTVEPLESFETLDEDEEEEEDEEDNVNEIKPKSIKLSQIARFSNHRGLKLARKSQQLTIPSSFEETPRKEEKSEEEEEVEVSKKMTKSYRLETKKRKLDSLSFGISESPSFTLSMEGSDLMVESNERPKKKTKSVNTTLASKFAKTYKKGMYQNKASYEGTTGLFKKMK